MSEAEFRQKRERPHGAGAVPARMQRYYLSGQRFGSSPRAVSSCAAEWRKAARPAPCACWRVANALFTTDGNQTARRSITLLAFSPKPHCPQEPTGALIPREPLAGGIPYARSPTLWPVVRRSLATLRTVTSGNLPGPCEIWRGNKDRLPRLDARFSRQT